MQIRKAAAGGAGEPAPEAANSTVIREWRGLTRDPAALKREVHEVCKSQRTPSVYEAPPGWAWRKGPRGALLSAGRRPQARLAEGPPAFARFPCDSMEPKFANPWLSRWFSKRLPGARLPGAGVQ